MNNKEEQPEPMRLYRSPFVHSIRVLCPLLICGGWHSPSVLAAPVAGKAKPTLNKIPSNPPVSKAPAYQEVRAALFAHLEAKDGSQMTIPDFPAQKLMVWIDRRSASVNAEEKSCYTLLGEHLLIAQKLLNSEDVPTRKQGFWIASESANFAAAKLKSDKWLLARIYEGFLLPQVNLANVELWQDPSRSRVMENGVSAFANAGERDKQTRVLEWIISIGEKSTETPTGKSDVTSLTVSSNTLDWARGTLAALLFEVPDVKRPDLERALALLQVIQSPDMKGFKHLQERVQARLDQLEKTATP